MAMDWQDKEERECGTRILTYVLALHDKLESKLRQNVNRGQLKNKFATKWVAKSKKAKSTIKGIVAHVGIYRCKWQWWE